MIAFARTIRALDADDFRGSTLGLLFAAVLLAGWTWWFFTPSIPQFSVRDEGSQLHATIEVQYPRVSPATIVLRAIR
jgi:hypothetical protein